MMNTKLTMVYWKSKKFWLGKLLEHDAALRAVHEGGNRKRSSSQSSIPLARNFYSGVILMSIAPGYAFHRRPCPSHGTGLPLQRDHRRALSYIRY